MKTALKEMKEKVEYKNLEMKSQIWTFKCHAHLNQT